MQQIPIPEADAVMISRLEAMHDLVACLFKVTAMESNTRDTLMRAYYEQILNALVYELYLPDDLHTAGLRFFELVAAAHLPQIDSDAHDSESQLETLRRKFEELYAPSHPLRAALQKLHTLEPIRIIENKT